MSRPALESSVSQCSRTACRETCWADADAYITSINLLAGGCNSCAPTTLAQRRELPILDRIRYTVSQDQHLHPTPPHGSISLLHLLISSARSRITHWGRLTRPNRSTTSYRRRLRASGNEPIGQEHLILASQLYEGGRCALCICWATTAEREAARTVWNPLPEQDRALHRAYGHEFENQGHRNYHTSSPQYPRRSRALWDTYDTLGQLDCRRDKWQYRHWAAPTRPSITLNEPGIQVRKAHIHTCSTIFPRSCVTYRGDRCRRSQEVSSTPGSPVFPQ